MFHLEFYNETKESISGKIFEDLLNTINDNFKQIFPKMLNKNKQYFISCTIVNDKLMEKINKQYRGKDQPTDVISLGYLEKGSFPGNDMAGEIFISFDTANRQANNLNHSTLTEIAFLFIHGILHILGYEHKEEKDFKLMMDLTNQILSLK
ncbi:rRNA maturation RNase YbeY [bacterium]|nr:rRNA maturation RNase YbeY [bacterium]